MDLTQGDRDLCPVHWIKMPVKEVPIEYGLAFPEIPIEVQKKECPFGDEIVLGGCVSSKNSPDTAKVYLCPKCVDASRRFLAEYHQRLEEAKKRIKAEKTK